MRRTAKLLRTRAALACMLSAVLGFGSAMALGPERLPSLHHRPRFGRANALLRVNTERPVVALTFDDGPDPRWTPTVLRLLSRYHARATFFLIGLDALAHPELVRRERAGGYEIGNHTFDHQDLELLRPDQVKAEIQGGARAIEKAGGGHPVLFRPPKGLTDEVVGVLANADHYRTVFWSLTVEHFVDNQDVRAGIEQLLARVHPGAIILAHDGGIPNRTRTMQALPMLFAGLHRRGYRMVDVSELIAMRDKT